MCNKTDAQIGKIIREALGEIVELEAEETRNKLLGLPRYEKYDLGHDQHLEIQGFSYRYALIYKSKASDYGTPNIIAVFRDEETCDIAAKRLHGY